MGKGGTNTGKYFPSKKGMFLCVNPGLEKVHLLAESGVIVVSQNRFPSYSPHCDRLIECEDREENKIHYIRHFASRPFSLFVRIGRMDGPSNAPSLNTQPPTTSPAHPPPPTSPPPASPPWEPRQADRICTVAFLSPIFHPLVHPCWTNFVFSISSLLYLVFPHFNIIVNYFWDF